MSKYDPLTDHLKQRRVLAVPMRFAEIERVLGFPLPPSSRHHRAWWSNNPSNNVMTRAWLAAGYETRDVDLGAERLVFQRLNAVEPPPRPTVERDARTEVRHPLFGALRGLVTLQPGTDLSEPADADWAGQDYDPEGR